MGIFKTDDVEWLGTIVSLFGYMTQLHKIFPLQTRWVKDFGVTTTGEKTKIVDMTWIKWLISLREKATEYSLVETDCRFISQSGVLF